MNTTHRASELKPRVLDFLDALEKESAELVRLGADTAAMKRTAEAFLAALGAELELEDGHDASAKVHSLKNSLRYQKRRRREANELFEEQGAPATRQHELDAMWFVRVGTSSPLVPARSLAQIYSDFGVEEMSHIGATSIFHTRNAWAELLKNFNREYFCRLVLAHHVTEDGCPLVIFVRHIHDEAPMRLRSFLADTVRAGALRRGPYSKIQNNMVRLVFAEFAFDWFTELQPLACKNSQTMASALILVVLAVLDAIDSQAVTRRVRVVHVLTGDGIQTNDSAAKRVLYHFRHDKTSPKWEYILLVFICASHMANLAVSTAICNGQGIKDPEKNDPICCACARLFKYLMPSYIQEFGSNLRCWVMGHAHMTEVDGPTPLPISTQVLRRLYGKDAIPDYVLAVVNGEFSLLEHRGAGLDRNLVCGQIYRTLFRRLMHCDEKPVCTRFFTFAECCFILLLFFLLQVPVTVFSVLGTTPNEDSQKRLANFCSWYSNPLSHKQVRRCCLALRLTLLATRITAQKNKTDGPHAGIKDYI